jgi:cellulose biosynthesis protein BcsQ
LIESLGYAEPDKLPITLATIMIKIIDEEPIDTDEGILHHGEGIDLMPSSIELSAIDVSLVNTMSREIVLRTYLNMIKQKYDYVLIDRMPSHGMMTINVLAAADSVVVQFLDKVLDAVKLLKVKQFRFQDTEEVFNNCIIQTVTLAGHALVNSLFAKPMLMVFHLILPTLVRVENKSRIIRNLGESFFEHIRYQIHAWVLADAVHFIKPLFLLTLVVLKLRGYLGKNL